MRILALLVLFTLPLWLTGCGAKNGTTSLENLFIKLTESISEKDYDKYRSCWQGHDETEFATFKKLLESDPSNKGKDARAIFEKQMFSHLEQSFEQIFKDLGNDLSKLTYLEYTPKDIDLTKEPSVMAPASDFAHAHRSGRVTIKLEVNGKKVNAYANNVYFNNGRYFLTDTVLFRSQEGQ